MTDAARGRSPGRPGAAPSLTDCLRRSSDEQLAELLRRRPDLGLPAPADLATLAGRLGVRTSVHRAVDALDAGTLSVLEALVVGGSPDGLHRLEDIAPLLHAPAPTIRAALDELRAVGLVWGPDDHLTLVPNAADAVGPYPAGLGRPAAHLLGAVSDVLLAPVLRRLGLPAAGQPGSAAAIADVLETPERVADLVATTTPGERALLDQLAAGPPVGAVRDALTQAALSDPSGPVDALVSRGLLIAVDARTVELPREVGLALRGPQPLGPLRADPPVIKTVQRTPAEADRLGTTAVRDLLRLVDALGVEWTARPPAVLRSGGVGVRELRRTARALDVDERVAALVAEIAGAAGLVGATQGIEPVILPTREFDTWHRRPPAQQWVTLASAWLAMTRQPSLVGRRDERERLITALGPDVERGTLPAVRRHALGVLGTLDPGPAPADRGTVLERLQWLAPRRADAQRGVVESVLDEADQLGMTAAGGLTGYGRALLARAGSTATAAASAAEHALTVALPRPVDHLLVQPDLTVVVPGPPTPELAQELGATADLESSGGAQVYRVTESSVRRALDSGRSGTDLAALFAQRSTTPVPQALSYLIDDVARRHGVLRAGAALAYLRCDDEALLSRVVADTDLAPLGLRRLAPTVAIASSSVGKILDALRESGYAPSAESPDGAVLTVGGDAARAPSRPPSRIARARAGVESPSHVAELIQRLRAGDQRAAVNRRVAPTAQRVPGVTTAATLGLLRDAIRRGDRIWVDYVDSHGTATQHTIAPISMAGGTLRGHDDSTGRLESFALHHITAVSVMGD